MFTLKYIIFIYFDFLYTYNILYFFIIFNRYKYVRTSIANLGKCILVYVHIISLGLEEKIWAPVEKNVPIWNNNDILYNRNNHYYILFSIYIVYILYIWKSFSYIQVSAFWTLYIIYYMYLFDCYYIWLLINTRVE